jgi:signal transduction histidine kinase
MQASRLQILLTSLAGVFLLGTVLIFAVFAVAPDVAVVYRPFLLSAFVVTIFISLVCISWLLRGLLRPYSQLVGEARRAPVTHSGKPQNEAAFVLETFQSVIAQLQSQQEELKRLSDQASQRADSAERFSDHIVASMPTGLIAFNSAGLTTVTNTPLRKLLSNELGNPGEHFSTVFISVPALADMVKECLTSGRIFRREEIKAINGSEQGKRFGATVAPIDPASESGARGVLCMITDITEVTRLREQVALKRNLESLGEMSAGLAHEFKNAMAALHGYAQFLQTINHDDQGKTAADALLHEVRNLSEMTTSFLNFARPQPLQLEDVSLEELIQECAHELGPLFKEREVELVIAGDAHASSAGRGTSADRGFLSVNPPRDAPLSVLADNRMLRQALLNLIRNAVEAIPRDHSDRRVAIGTSLETDQGQQWAAVSIQDTGQGISPADLQKIFIPFFTTKTGGHGIGLALAHRVIIEHGGTLTVANNPGGGALFVIRLPQGKALQPDEI